MHPLLINPCSCLSQGQGQGKPSLLLAIDHAQHTQAKQYTFSAAAAEEEPRKATRWAVGRRGGDQRPGPGMAANVGAGRSVGGSCGGAGGTTTGGGGSGSVAVCRPSGSRWTPTPEQIRVLKELYYGCGIRSPNSEQIQRITAMLRQHGKIEGKNVFYWFQNHKARERQKRRLTNLDVNVVPAAGANVGAAEADDGACSTHLGVLSLSSPSGAAPPSANLAFYTTCNGGGGGGGSALLLDTSSDWGSTSMPTETCFLQDYMGVMSTGGSAGAASASPWACFSSSSDPRAVVLAPTTVTTRAPETLPLFPTGDDSQRHGVLPEAAAGEGDAIRGGSSYHQPTLPFWGAAPTTATATTSISVAVQQQHQLMQLQEQYSFYSNTQLPSQDASAAASLELSLSSWCSTYPAGTM